MWSMTNRNSWSRNDLMVEMQCSYSHARKIYTAIFKRVKKSEQKYFKRVLPGDLVAAYFKEINTHG